uniref:Uncharacterized protein n=1 Tax=Anguilla anguilla TaxID=7936 RepID=A0A0E9XEB7_ANGAN
MKSKIHGNVSFIFAKVSCILHGGKYFHLFPLPVLIFVLSFRDPTVKRVVQPIIYEQSCILCKERKETFCTWHEF